MKSSKCDLTKLKTNLSLCINRLTVVATRRSERSRASRQIICECLMHRKLEQAKVRAEEMIRDDYYVEALDLLKTYYTAVSLRLAVLQHGSEPEATLKEAISTIIWASNLLSLDVPECKSVVDVFTKLFGKRYVEDCLAGSEDTISPRVKQKIDIIPGFNMIEVYMMEIANAYNIPYKPDEKILSTLLAASSLSSKEEKVVSQPRLSLSDSSKPTILRGASGCANSNCEFPDSKFTDTSNVPLPSAPAYDLVSSMYECPQPDHLNKKDEKRP